MSPSILILCGSLLFVLVVALRVARSGRPSLLVVLVGLALMSMGALGSWYSWAESQSLPWTLGYGFLGLIGAILLVRQVSAFVSRSGEPSRPSATKAPR